MQGHGGDVYRYPGFLDFSANINLLGPPAAAVRAAQASIDEIGHYPQAGDKRLRQAIAKLEQIQPEQIVCGNGAAEVIFLLAQALRPRKAIVFAPAFQEYERALKSVGCEIVYERLYEEEGFHIREVPSNLDDSVDMVFLCNPNNPTGALTEPKIMERLLARCGEADALLAVDECFLDFAETESGAKETSRSMKRFLTASEHLFLVKAFTKTFGIPGLRLGYGLCANQAVLNRIQAVTQPWNVSVPAQEAGIAAAGEQGFLERSRRAVCREKRFLLEGLSRYQRRDGQEEHFFAEIYGHAANFIFFRSIPRLREKLMKYGILIRDCSNFYGLSEGWYRIAVRPREENERLLQALKDMSERKRL